MNITNILEQLSFCISPSGFEYEIKNCLIQLTKQLGYPHYEDVFGNLIWTKKGNSDKTVMIVAHLDEIGLIIKHIDEYGFLRISKIGGANAHILKGCQITIKHGNKYITGVIGCKPIHMKDLFKSGDLEFSDLWVDIGTTNREEAAQIVSIGDVAVVKSAFSILKDTSVCGRALDNHAGLVAMLNIMNIIHVIPTDYNIVFVASSQEELGGRGAIIAASNIRPDIAIAIDVCHATDYPTVNKAKYGDIKLGKGAVIPIGTDFAQVIQKQLTKAAITNLTPYQIDAGAGSSGTDINKIQITGQGCLTGLVCIPCRYMHTANEVISITDIKSCTDIIVNFIKYLKESR